MKNRVLMWIAWHLPGVLVYYAACRLFDEMTEHLPAGPYGLEAGRLPYRAVLNDWVERKGMK